MVHGDPFWTFWLGRDYEISYIYVHNFTNGSPCTIKQYFIPKYTYYVVYVDKHWCSQRRVFLTATMLFLVLCLFYDIFYALQTKFFPRSNKIKTFGRREAVATAEH